MLNKTTFMAACTACLFLGNLSAFAQVDPEDPTHSYPNYNEFYYESDGVEDNAGAKTGIYDVRNILKNPGFEEGTSLNGTESYGQFIPNEWGIESEEVVYAPGVGGIRVCSGYMVDGVDAFAGTREGLCELWWRDDAWGLSEAALYQGVSLKPNTCYMAIFRVISHDNGKTDDVYYVGAGSTPSGLEYGSTDFNPAEPSSPMGGNRSDVEFYFVTPDEVPEVSYFTIKNTTYASGDPEPKKSTTWGILHLDRMTLAADENATAINDVETSNVRVYSKDGRLVVTGADEYKIYSITGSQVNADSQLLAGIYVVSANGKQYKVAVK